MTVRGADPRVLLDHDMADQPHILAQRHARPDRTPRPDLDPVGQHGGGVDDGGRVNSHQAAGSGTVTTMAMNSASAASLPSMKVSPRNL